jgi:hypothetical protein
MLTTSRKIAAAIGTAASRVLRRGRLKSKIANAPNLESGDGVSEHPREWLGATRR